MLVKLVSGSRFVAFQQQHLSSLNAFLDELEPRVAEFLEALVTLPTTFSALLTPQCCRLPFHYPTGLTKKRAVSSRRRWTQHPNRLGKQYLTPCAPCHYYQATCLYFTGSFNLPVVSSSIQQLQIRCGLCGPSLHSFPRSRGPLTPVMTAT